MAGAAEPLIGVPDEALDLRIEVGTDGMARIIRLAARGLPALGPDGGAEPADAALPVEVEVEVDVVDAAGPPQAARVSAALVASSAAGALQLLARRLRGMLSVTGHSVSWCSAVPVSCSFC